MRFRLCRFVTCDLADALRFWFAFLLLFISCFRKLSNLVYFFKSIFVAIWICFKLIIYVRFWKIMYFSNMFDNIRTRFSATFTHVFHIMHDISHYTYPTTLSECPFKKLIFLICRFSHATNTRHTANPSTNCTFVQKFCFLPKHNFDRI